MRLTLALTMEQWSALFAASYRRDISNDPREPVT